MSKRRFLYSIGLSLLLVGASLGCEGDKGKVPDSSDERMKQATQRLPADSQMAFLFSDLEKFRSNAEKSKATIERLMTADSLMGSATESGFAKKFMGDAGFEKLLDKKFWKKRGVAPNSSFTLAGVGYNQVIHTYVADKKAFEKTLTGGKKAAKKVKVAKTDAKKLKNGGNPIYWTYQGKLVTVVYPGHEMAPPDADREKTEKTLERVLTTKKKESLRKTSGFQKFKSAAGDRPSLVYLNIEPILDRQDLAAMSGQRKKFMKTLRDSLDGGGLIVETSDQKRIKTRLWMGLTEKAKKKFDEAFNTSVTADWSKFSSAQTLMALRLSLDWKSIWKSFESALPKKQAQMLEAQFQKAKKESGLDMREDIIGNLSAQAGIYVYGIGGEASPKVIANPASALSDLEALYVMKFGDKETLSKIAESVAGLSEDYLKLRPLELGGEEGDAKKVKSVRVLEMKMPPGGVRQMMTGQAPPSQESGSDKEPKPAPVRAFVHEDTMMLAATALSEKRVHHMLTGEGDGPKGLADRDKLDLGEKFASTDQLTGLYVNFVRFRNIFAKVLSARMMPPAAKEAATTMQEALLATTPHEKGVFLDLTLDLAPKAAGGGGSEKGGGEKKGGNKQK